MVGSGSARSAVDRVELSLNVELLRPEPAAAFKDAAASVSAVLAVLADAGIDSRKVRTADLRLGPVTRYQDNSEVLIGYSCGQRLVVSVDGLGLVPRLLSSLVTTGIDGVRLEGISFSTSDPEPAAKTARELAMQDARAKAEHLTALAGVQLGGIRSIAEVQGGMDVPVRRQKMAFAAAASDMAISGGEADTTVTVAVTYEIV